MAQRTLSLVRSTVAGLSVMTLADAARAQHVGAFVLDVRGPDAFAAGHLPGSVNIAADDPAGFEELRDALLPSGVDVVVVGPAEAAARALELLAGHAPVLGHLADPGAAAASRRVPTLDRAGAQQVVDVRCGGRVVGGAIRIPVADVLGRLAELRPDVTTAVLDGDGRASSAVASLLRACGFRDVTEVVETLDRPVRAVSRPRLRLLASA
ncbi:rhodanese-like domain-containing protein [Pseudonocardia sp.]|uniref:rhodanese-like domain-containing protein n=1 Tax=Pseudonocardia sp. TaxID=60912 RepID=UPI003D1456F6